MEEELQLKLFEDDEYTGEKKEEAAAVPRDTSGAVTTLTEMRRISLPMLSLRAFAVHPAKAIGEVPPVLLAEHMLVFVTEGSITCRIGDEDICAAAGDCMYAPPGVLFSRRESRAPAAYMELYFWDDTPRRAGQADRVYPFPHKMTYEDDPDVRATVGYLRRVCENGTPDQRRKQLASLQMLLIQLEDCVLRWSPNDYVREMKKYMLAHYRAGVKLEDLAAVVGLHPVYCAKVFRENEGKTVVDFINELRITRARAQLEDAIETSDVARDLGLSEYYFSRWFRRMTGVTPTEYRDSLRGAYIKH